MENSIIVDVNKMEITEIQEKHLKFKRLQFILYLLFFIMLVTIFFTIQNVDNTKYFIFITIIVLLIGLFSSNFFPPLSTYESIRYNLNELIVSCNSKDSKRAKGFVNELANDIHISEDELEDVFILNYAREILHDFWFMLKYEVYPLLPDREKMKTCAIYLEQIDKAIYNEDINQLHNITKSYITDSKPDETILLPYEKPFIINQIFSKLKEIISINFNKNIFFRFIVLSAIFSIIMYPFISFNEYVILGIGSISAILASGYKSKT